MCASGYAYKEIHSNTVYNREKKVWRMATDRRMDNKLWYKSDKIFYRNKVL